MTTALPLNVLIERAVAIAGSYRKLADMVQVDAANLSAMKAGRRPCNWLIRGRLRAILGEDYATAFTLAMAEDLAESENPDEKKAAQQLAAMVEAFAGAGGSGGSHRGVQRNP